MKDDERGTQMELPLENQAGRSLQAGKPPTIWLCDICGAEVLDLHCKLRCTNCGFMRDCSDP
jgi:hypothetical protein